MSTKSRNKAVPTVFGPLPHLAINEALDLEIDAGDVQMTVRAQRHVQNKRPAEFAWCFPHVAAVIASPLHVRDDFINDGKIELVGRPVGMSEFLLVAVEISLDADGRYNVVSFYPVSEAKVNGRRDKGHLRRVTLI